MIVSLVIAVFLFRLKDRSLPTVFLAWTFSGGTLTNLSLLLEFACPYYWQPSKIWHIIIPIAQVIGPCTAATFLVLFAYYFPHFQNPDRREFRIAFFACVAAAAGTLAAAIINFVVLQLRDSNYEFVQTYYIILYIVLAAQFTLSVFLLFRKAVRFSKGKHRSWLLRLIRSQGNDALAARSLGLVLCLLPLAVGGYILMTLGMIPYDYATYLIWLIFLLFYFSFVVTYLNNTIERTTFQVKLVGLALVFVVGILSLVSVVVGRSFAEDYAPRDFLAGELTLHFRPGTGKSYTITGGALQFDEDLGRKIDLGVDEYETAPMSFDFPFFERPYRSLVVLHGPMVFLGSEIREMGWGGYNPQPTIAPLLLNLDPSRGEGIFIKNQSNRLMITWYRLPEVGFDNRITVQLILFPDGSFEMSYGKLDIHSRYSSIRMYVFTSANLTGRHPGASGEPVPSGPKLIGIHPGAEKARLERIHFSTGMRYESKHPGPAVIFESHERDFQEYLHRRMAVLVVIMAISSVLVLSVFPRLFRRSLIQPLQALQDGMKRVDSGDLRVTVTPRFKDEVGALTLYFNRMLDSVREAEAKDRLYQQLLIRSDKLTTLGILSSSVAHEINNPNAVILTFTRLLLRAWFDAHGKIKKYIEGKEQVEIGGFGVEELIDNIAGWLRDIESNSVRINAIVQNLRSYVRGESSIMTSVNLSTVARSAVELSSYHIKRATDRFSLQLEEPIQLIRGNPPQLEQVAINLIMNACQALTGRNEAVEILTTCDRQRGLVSLIVRDEGCGLCEADTEKIGQPFFTTRKEAGGTGLGLYIVTSVVNEHKGTFSLTSAIGEGTTVAVTFPVEEEK